MPPPTTASPQDVIRYLSRLLSACCLMHPDDTLRIPSGMLDRVSTEAKGAESPRILFEDFDTATNEIVLRFRQQSLAQYFVKEPCQTPQPTSSTNASPEPKPTSSTVSVVPPPAQSSSTQPQGRHTIASPSFRHQPLALDDQTLARIQRTVRQLQLNREANARRSRSSSPLDENLFG